MKKIFYAALMIVGMGMTFLGMVSVQAASKITLNDLLGVPSQIVTNTVTNTLTNTLKK